MNQGYILLDREDELGVCGWTERKVFWGLLAFVFIGNGKECGDIHMRLQRRTTEAAAGKCQEDSVVVA